MPLAETGNSDDEHEGQAPTQLGEGKCDPLQNSAGSEAQQPPKQKQARRDPQAVLQEHGINTQDLPVPATLSACRAIAGGKDVLFVLEELRNQLGDEHVPGPSSLELEFSAPNCQKEIQDVLDKINNVSHGDANRMNKLLVALCEFGRMSFQTLKVPNAANLGSRENASILGRFIREHSENLSEVTDATKPLSKIVPGSVVLKSGTADAYLIQTIGLRGGKSYKAVRHFYEDQEDKIRLWCNKLILLPRAELPRGTI